MHLNWGFLKFQFRTHSEKIENNPNTPKFALRYLKKFKSTHTLESLQNIFGQGCVSTAFQIKLGLYQPS